MALMRCGLTTNGSKKELQPHGTPAFPCAGYEETYYGSIEEGITWHWHEELEVHLVRKGTLKLHVMSEVFLVKEGQIAVINSNEYHAACGDPSCEVYCMVFSPTLITGNQASVFAEKYISKLTSNSNFSCVILGDEIKDEAALYEKAFQALKYDEFGHEFLVREALSKLFLKVFKAIGPDMDNENEQSAESERISKMLDMIHASYDQPIGLSDIASAAGISEREATRCFNRTISETPVQYLVKYRIAVGAAMLVDHPSKPVAEVAEECGFDSPSYFSKKFKELYRCTPREFRRGIAPHIPIIPEN